MRATPPAHDLLGIGPGFPDPLDRGIVVEHFRELLWGALLASYRCEAFKGKKRSGPRAPARLTIVAGEDAPMLRKGISPVRAMW